MADDELPPIVIKKIKKIIAGSHGGAWKVAYADFVTAMMAFFMMLWLLNVTDQETLEGLADYFTPTVASISTSSGSGNILAGTSPSTLGSASSGATAVKFPAAPPSSPADQVDIKSGTGDQGIAGGKIDSFQSTINSLADNNLIAAADRLKQVIQDTPELAEHLDQIIMEQTPEGLRIQIIDKDRRSMFRINTAEPFDYAILLIQEVGDIVNDLPNRIAIMGHTSGADVGTGPNYGIWEMSAERANVTRRILAASGVTQDRFSQVTAMADTEPMFPDRPNRPENRRITILVIREAPALSPIFTEQQF